MRRLAGRAGSARACAAGEDAASSEAQVAVVFLLDGSGSVTEGGWAVGHGPPALGRQWVAEGAWVEDGSRMGTCFWALSACI